jgi:hypothetical protein
MSPHGDSEKSKNNGVSPSSFRPSGFNNEKKPLGLPGGFLFGYFAFFSPVNPANRQF